MEDNGNRVKLGDGIWSAAKNDVNDRSTMIVSNLVEMFFDYLDQKVQELPEAIRQMKSNPETNQEIIKMWSDNLYEQGLVPSGYVGLPDEILIKNFQQEGYLDGLYAGYALALTKMYDNGVQNEIIIAVRNAMRPYLLGHRHENKAEFTELLKNEKYVWIDKEK